MRIKTEPCSMYPSQPQNARCPVTPGKRFNAPDGDSYQTVLSTDCQPASPTPTPTPTPTPPRPLPFWSPSMGFSNPSVWMARLGPLSRFPLPAPKLTPQSNQ